MKNIIKIIFILIICFCITGVFLHINTAEYKMQSFEGKFTNEIATLKPICKEATNYCNFQNFTNRGEYTACMEEKIKASSSQKYKFYMDVQNFCENLFDDLADKWMCIDEIMN